METKHKEFKPFDKVIVRNHYDKRWKCDFYSHKTGENGVQTIHDVYGIENILPYEGNEELVGTTDSPDEGIRLEEGELVMYAFGGLVSIYPLDYKLGKFLKINKEDNTITIQDSDAVRGSSKFIKFSDFNPSDMKGTKKNILCVKNGKVVKYKG